MKIISGGQTGVDQAALQAAKEAGLPTGGYMPTGWLTLEGIRADFAELYGMEAMASGGYRERTHLNVKTADATIRFAKTFGSPGERCTMIAIRQNNKPHLDINWHKKDPLPSPSLITEWLQHHNINILNVAGNSEQTAPGINRVAYQFFLSVFILLGETTAG